MKLIELTATGRYYKVYLDGAYVSQHTTEREAIESAQEQAISHPDSVVIYKHEYEVDVGLTDAGVTVAQILGVTDTPPTIISTPSPSFTQGTGGTYDMTQHVSDDGQSTVTYSLTNVLPNGLSFNPTTGILTYDGVGAETTSQHQLIATDAVGFATSASFNVRVTAIPQAPALWEWDVPTLAEETQFYTNVLGWTIPAGANSFASSRYAWSTTYTFGDVHNSTEGDNLWTWDQQVKRYGAVSMDNGLTIDQYLSNILAVFKSDLLTELDADDSGGTSGDGYDHIYGQGLCTVYNDTGDPAIPAVLEGLRTRLAARPKMIDAVSGTPVEVSRFLLRGVSRWALVSAYCYQVLQSPQWQTLRDAMVFAFTTATDWEEGGVIRNGGGMYFASSSQSSSDGITGYAGGRRYQWGPGIALASEAMWRMYVQTGNEILRQRLIKMARYVEYYAHDPSWAFPNAGSRWGHEGDGSRFHNGGGDSGSFSNAADNCSYDICLVNPLIYGYKLTGDSNLLNRAIVHFIRGNRWNPGTPFENFAAASNEAYLYLDISANPGSPTSDEFLYNKGQLQYAYQILDNGGAPSQVSFGGPLETFVGNLTSGQWDQFTEDTANLAVISVNTLDINDGSAIDFSHQLFWNSATKEMHIRCGPQSTSNVDNSGIHLRYTDSQGTWDAVTPWLTGQKWTHQWGHFAGDPKTGDLYFRALNSQNIHKWSYQQYPYTSTDATGNTSWPLHSTGIWGNRNAQSLDWFPDMNNGDGGLVYFDTFGDTDRLYYSDRDGQNWQLVPGSTGIHGFPMYVECVGQYLPGQQWFVWGGGKEGQFSGDLRPTTHLGIARMDANLSIQVLPDLPTSWGSPSNMGKIVGHPNGRVFLIGGATSPRLYESTDNLATWNDIGALPFSMFYGAAAIIPEWDCIYVLAKLAGGPTGTIQEWIYKL